MYEFLIVTVLIASLMGLVVGTILEALSKWACQPKKRVGKRPRFNYPHNLRRPRFTRGEGVSEKSQGGLKARWSVKT